MTPRSLYVTGLGLQGPGLAGWEPAVEVLAGHRALIPGPVNPPPAAALPPAERRRVGLAVRLALATGFEAVAAAALDPAHLATVFSSTSADCDTCHQILETLASADRALSPTRFQNSVHNAPSGYWSIATGCTAPSTSLCAYDATFAAGLIETAAQAMGRDAPCLLVAYDTPYPEPLNALRPLPYPMGLSLVLDPRPSPQARARLTLRLDRQSLTTMTDPALEALRTAIPAARALPLLQLLATGRSGEVTVEYLSPASLAITVEA